MLDQPPAGLVRSTDGTPIAWFREPGDPGTTGRAALLLVHGTTADHTTFRAFGPRMAASRVVIAVDRRGRGDSGDGSRYAFGRELEDVAAVASAMADSTGGPVDVFGHSFGGRCALGAAPLAPDAIRRVVSYEGAIRAGSAADDARLADELAALEADGRWADLLETFLRQGVGMSDEEWQTFREAPVWERRLAAAPTVVRELRTGREPAGSLARLATLRQPVLQVVGSASSPDFLDGARAFQRLLSDGRLVTIEGARHAAHHTHVDPLVQAVTSFLDG